ncbi:hypothetical protein FH972_026787 [Carpinus fangiana]|uniref:Uncharacterized protein n=1 Tax=Carpinus fangiana TaxID=176857 RepID=A0A5N6L7J2_9ROSI|nr:hypothetical protein FH972_026787 [Carpinus fangiana]
MPESLGNPCLDLFLFVGPNSSHLSVYALLELASSDNPLTTLKLILNMRKLRSQVPFWRFLYNQISDIFSDLLKSDLDLLKSSNLHKISLAAKVRDRLHKEIIAPLRRALNLLEFYMSLSKWSLHDYIPAAEVTTKLLKETVLTHSKDINANGAVSIALRLLISELSEGPWERKDYDIQP